MPLKLEKPPEPDVNYVIGGKLLKKLAERKFTGKVGQVNIVEDKDGNITISLATQRCLVVDSGELRYADVAMTFRA